MYRRNSKGPRIGSLWDARHDRGPGFYTKLNVWGSLGLNFDYDGGPIIENGVPSFYISLEFWEVVHPSI